MKLWVKIVGAVAVVAASFVATLWLTDQSVGTCPSGRLIALERPFAKFFPDGVAYQKGLMGLNIPGDVAEAPDRSPLVLCEDDKLIGIAHSQHVDIGKQGRGRYSHWGSVMIFSTSDNSDPNTNGRSYVAVVPR